MPMRINLPDPQAFARILQSVTGCSPDILPTGIVTDSRECLAGDLFVAIPGDRVDGHDYLARIQASSASAALVNRMDAELSELPQLVMADTVKTLGELASKWRSRFNIPVIGITGSNGKTTTKELLAHILSASRIVHATKGNFNTSVGLPLTLLELTETHDISVLEMGANQPGDIALLAGIANPTHGLITNIAPAHLEGFGSIERVAETKAELFNALGDGISFVNQNDKLISSLPIFGDQVSFGFQSYCDFSADVLPQTDGNILLVVNAGELDTGSTNPVFAQNVLAATTIAVTLDESWSMIQNRILSFKIPAGRCVVKPLGRVTVIDDTYNANLASVSAAIDFLKNFQTSGRRILVFGDMFELGDESPELHRQVGVNASQASLNAVFTLGTESIQTTDALNGIDFKQHFTEKSELTKVLQNYLLPDDVILFKGSRGMAMEQIIAELGEI